ncbi:TlpA family protein disulfide reductase [Parachryseolinea silvisoli]|uniref:TlpA family protein disulfide reductase n=1 Tax=Parachryseolinea silvisoli TaxID=2873601 RepID=UPI0022659612|nr:TlpA disulfide reductase family protein [Parachryseolinea silvisoli]MCD9018096.1 TlpA family protein disulfide reductase [Parachryseolinea silvisoli]
MRRKIVAVLLVSTLIHLAAQAQSQTPAVGFLPSDSIRNYPAPVFIMKDLTGKDVSLTDYRGKVLVLDFWATWCGPCHETVPFVVETMKHYKDDANVRFLFVNTRERSANSRDLVSKYIARNQYDFTVVLDELDADGKQERFYRAFHVAGLPTRMVIDGNGIVRFESIGYPTGKTNEELSAILSSMIEAAKVTQ